MGFFIYIFAFVMFLTGTFLYFDPSFENVTTYHNIKNETNIKAYDNPDNVLKKQNHINLEDQKNQIFQLSPGYNLFLSAEYFDDETGTYRTDSSLSENISLETVKRYSLDFETLNIDKDYIAQQCSRGVDEDCKNFMFSTNKDYIIFKLASGKPQKINQIVLNSDDLVTSKISLSFLQKTAEEGILFANEIEYFLNPGTNIMKFPLIDAKATDEVFIKVKLLEKDI